MLLRRKIFYSFIICCIFLFTLELGVRVIKSLKHHNVYWLFFGLPWSDTYALPKADYQAKVAEIQVTNTIQKDGYYLFKPGIHVMQLIGQDDVEVKVNSLGFRGKEISRKKPDGIIRIFCLGGSAVYGINVRDEETYPAFLERCLGKGFEVVNAGFPGANSSMILALFRSEVLSLDPDIAIFYAAHNDHSARTKPKSSSFILKIHGSLYYRSLFYTLGSEKISMLFSGHTDPIHELYNSVIFDREDSQRIIRLYRNNLTELIKTGQQRGVTLFLVTQPLKFPTNYPKLSDANKITELEQKKDISWSDYAYYMQSKLVRELRDVGVRYNLPVVDCVKRFEDLPYLEYIRVFSDTVHLTSQGNKLLGNILCEFIKSRKENR